MKYSKYKKSLIKLINDESRLYAFLMHSYPKNAEALKDKEFLMLKNSFTYGAIWMLEVFDIEFNKKQS